MFTRDGCVHIDLESLNVHSFRGVFDWLIENDSFGDVVPTFKMESFSENLFCVDHGKPVGFALNGFITS